MEPETHPFEIENHLNQTFTFVFQPLVFGGVKMHFFLAQQGGLLPVITGKK